MARVYVYAPNEADCSTIGICGALMPTECEFNLKAGEFGELTMKHPLDPYGKWTYLQQEYILKVAVPVRVVPSFRMDEGHETEYITQYSTYRVAAAASTENRTVYKGSAATNKKKVKTAPAGQELIVTGIDNDSRRYHVSYTPLGRNGRPQRAVTGWMAEAGIDTTTEEVHQIANPGVNALEAVEKSYAVKDQLFRIYEVRKTDDDGGTVEVSAMRIVYDLNGIPSGYQSGDVITGATAARSLLSDAYIRNTGFTIYSDVGTQHIGFDGRFMSVLKALIDPDDGIAGQFNGQVIADDYEVYLLAQAGMDRGVHIRYGKDMSGVECDTDMTDTVEGILPYGEDKDGLPLFIVAGTDIGEGYERRGRNQDNPSSGPLVPEIIYKTGVSTNAHRIEFLKVKDAKEDKKAAVTVEMARAAMVEAVHDEFEKLCYAASVTMDVEFTQLGDSEEYEQFKHLESLFVYDTVHIHHWKLGISVEETLTEITWDCVADRIKEAKFGELKDLNPTVTSAQLSGVSGGKIMTGSISGQQLADGAISERLIRTDAVVADTIAAEAVTADKINALSIGAETVAAQALRAQFVEAVRANLQTLTAGMIRAGQIDADTIEGQMAAFEMLRAQSAEMDREAVHALFVDTGIVDEANFEDAYAAHLRVSYLNAANATIGRCVLLGTDGKYHEVHVGADGSVTTTVVTPTQSERTAGVMADGRTLVDDTSVYTALSAETFNAIHAAINKLDAKLINVDSLFARQAFVDALTTSQIFAKDGRLMVLPEYIRDSQAHAYTLTPVTALPSSGAEGETVMLASGSSRTLYRRTGDAWSAVTPVIGDTWTNPAENGTVRAWSGSAWVVTDTGLDTVVKDLEGTTTTFETTRRVNGAWTNAIKKTVAHYLATSAKKNVTKATKGWTTEPQETSKRKPYLWIYYTYTTVDGTTTDSIPSINGVQDLEYDDIAAQYCLSTSDTDITPTPTWSGDIPLWQKGKYIWRRYLCEYPDGRQVTTEPQCVDMVNDALRVDSFEEATFDAIDGIGTVYIRPTQPTTGVQVNDIWLDTVNDKVYRFKTVGGQIAPVDVTEHSGALAEAIRAANIADSKMRTYCLPLMQPVTALPSSANVDDVCMKAVTGTGAPYQRYIYRATGWALYNVDGDFAMIAESGAAKLYVCDGAKWSAAAVDKGDLWTNPVDYSKIYSFNGTGWVEVGSGTESVTAQVESMADELERQSELVERNRAKTQYFEFDTGSGLHIRNAGTDTEATSELVLSSTGMTVSINGEAEDRHYSEFSADYARFGNYKMRLTGEGGMAFIFNEGGVG